MGKSSGAGGDGRAIEGGRAAHYLLDGVVVGEVRGRAGRARGLRRRRGRRGHGRWHRRRAGSSRAPPYPFPRGGEQLLWRRRGGVQRGWPGLWDGGEPRRGRCAARRCRHMRVEGRRQWLRGGQGHIEPPRATGGRRQWRNGGTRRGQGGGGSGPRRWNSGGHSGSQQGGGGSRRRSKICCRCSKSLRNGGIGGGRRKSGRSRQDGGTSGRCRGSGEGGGRCEGSGSRLQGDAGSDGGRRRRRGRRDQCAGRRPRQRGRGRAARRTGGRLTCTGRAFVELEELVGLEAAPGGSGGGGGGGISGRQGQRGEKKRP